MTITKEKTNLYLNKELKTQAKEKLQKYGLNLSSFTNLMLAKFLQKDIDILLPNETKQVLDDFETKKDFETPKDINSFIQDLK